MKPLHSLFPYASEFPASWLSLLSTIRVTVGAPLVLAGGALRDHFHSVLVKDLDFFLPYSEEAVEKLQDLFEAMGFDCIQNIGLSCSGLSECAVVLGYSDGLGLTPSVNLIFLKPEYANGERQMVERLDFGICQIGVFFNDQDNVEFYYTDAFVDDVEKLTFTLTRDTDQERSLRRFHRLQEKYPYHRLVTRG